MVYSRRKRDPRTKEEVLDRMLSFDFEGDVRGIGAQTASLVRTGPNKMLLTFPDSGVTYELEVHRPRKVETSRPEYRPGQILAPEPQSFKQADEPDGGGGRENEPAPRRPRRSHPPERPTRQA